MTDSQPDSFAERSIGDTPYYGDQTAWYFYAQDNWRIRPNITLNLGVRYEYTTIPYTQRLQKLNAIASVPGLVDFKEPNAAKNNWAPRIGIAYSPGSDGKTSIRAGFGIAYDVLYDNLGILSAPPELQQTVDCNTIGTPGGQGGYYCDGVNNPLYANGFLTGGGLPSTGNTTFPDQASAAAVTSAYVPVDQKSPKSLDWTLGVQHAFANDYTVEVRYVGTRGIHLPAQIRLNNQTKTTSDFFLPTYTTNPGHAASTPDHQFGRYPGPEQFRTGMGSRKLYRSKRGVLSNRGQRPVTTVWLRNSPRSTAMACSLSLRTRLARRSTTPRQTFSARSLRLAARRTG